MEKYSAISYKKWQNPEINHTSFFRPGRGRGRSRGGRDGPPDDGLVETLGIEENDSSEETRGIEENDSSEENDDDGDGGRGGGRFRGRKRSTLNEASRTF